MPHIQSADGARIEYRVLGSGDLPVLLIHGWMVSGAIFDTFLPYLAPAGAGTGALTGVRVIIPDLRGSGASDKPDSGYTLDAYVADLVAIADAEGVGSMAVLGHSMGGLIAQYLAIKHPERVRALMLVNTVPASGVPFPDEQKAFFRSAAGSAEVQGMIVDTVCTSLSAAERARMMDVAATVTSSCVAQAFEVWSAGGFAHELGAISAPTLVVATDDPAMPPAFLQEAVAGPIPGARMAVLPGCGHYPQCERPRELAALVTAFVTGLG